MNNDQNKAVSKPVSFLCLDLCSNSIDSFSDTIEELELDITQRVEMAMADGYYDVMYKFFLIVKVEDVIKLKWFTDSYVGYGDNKKHVRKYWTPASILKWIKAERTGYGDTPRYETMPTVPYGKYDNKPAIGDTPRQRWTDALQVAVKEQFGKTMSYYASNPSSWVDAMDGYDGDPMELMPF